MDEIVGRSWGAYTNLTCWLDRYWPRYRIGFEPGTRGARFIRWLYGPTATLCESFWILLGLGLKKVFGRPAYAMDDFLESRSKVFLLSTAVILGLSFLLVYVGPMIAIFMDHSTGRVRYESRQIYEVVLWPWIELGIILAVLTGVLLITLFVKFVSKHLCPVVLYIKKPQRD